MIISRSLLIAIPSVVFILLGSPALASDPDELVKKRQENFEVLGKQAKGMRNIVRQSNPDWSDLEQRLKLLQTASSRIIGYFPKKSAKTSQDTDAKPEIWDNFDDFIQLQQALDISLLKLGDAIASKDSTGLKNAYRALGSSCKNCHKKYRED